MPQARCVGYQVQRWTQDGALETRLQGRFEHACNLVTEDRRLVVLLDWPRPGPATIVTPGMRAVLDRLAEGEAAQVTARAVVAARSGPIVRLDGAPVWAGLSPPAGPLASPAARRAQVLAAARTALRMKHRAGFVGLLPELVPHLRVEERDTCCAPGGEAHTPVDAGIAARALAAIGGLREALLVGAAEEACTCAHRLIGLGPGLTPSGDDFLTGLVLTLVLASRARGGQAEWVAGFGQRVAELAIGRTTVVSEHQLRYAADGQGDLVIGRAAMAILWALEQAHRPVQALLQIGASSGGDALAGVCVASGLVEAVLG